MSNYYFDLISWSQSFAKNSSFYVKQHISGEVQFLFFRDCLVALTKFSHWEEDVTVKMGSLQ